MPKINLLTTALNFQVANVTLLQLYQSFPTDTSPRSSATTPPAPGSPEHRLFSTRNRRALLQTAPRILLLLRYGATNPKSGRALGPESAQRPRPQARSSAHHSNRLWGVHATARAGASQTSARGFPQRPSFSQLRVNFRPAPRAFRALLKLKIQFGRCITPPTPRLGCRPR